MTEKVFDASYHSLLHGLASTTQPQTAKFRVVFIEYPCRIYETNVAPYFLRSMLVYNNNMKFVIVLPQYAKDVTCHFLSVIGLGILNDSVTGIIKVNPGDNKIEYTEIQSISLDDTYNLLQEEGGVYTIKKADQVISTMTTHETKEIQDLDIQFKVEFYDIIKTELISQEKAREIIDKHKGYILQSKNDTFEHSFRCRRALGHNGMVELCFKNKILWLFPEKSYVVIEAIIISLQFYKNDTSSILFICAILLARRSGITPKQERFIKEYIFMPDVEISQVVENCIKFGNGNTIKLLEECGKCIINRMFKTDIALNSALLYKLQYDIHKFTKKMLYYESEKTYFQNNVIKILSNEMDHYIRKFTELKFDETCTRCRQTEYMTKSSDLLFDGVCHVCLTQTLKDTILRKDSINCILQKDILYTLISKADKTQKQMITKSTQTSTKFTETKDSYTSTEKQVNDIGTNTEIATSTVSDMLHEINEHINVVSALNDLSTTNNLINEVRAQLNDVILTHKMVVNKHTTPEMIQIETLQLEISKLDHELATTVQQLRVIKEKANVFQSKYEGEYTANKNLKEIISTYMSDHIPSNKKTPVIVCTP